MLDSFSDADVTLILQQWRQGDRQAVQKLLPLVYDELRRLARRHLRHERLDHSLQPTALVHEAYLRLVDKVEPQWHDRLHFYAVAAQLMRRVLVDHARRHGAAKRGGDIVKVSLDEALARAGDKAADVLALDDALRALAQLDERKARIVELRYFGGLTVDETARVVGVSMQTVINDTRAARAWLYREMSGRQDDAG